MEENDSELLTFGYEFTQRQVVCRKCDSKIPIGKGVFVMRDGHYHGRDIFLCLDCAAILSKALHPEMPYYDDEEF